MKNRVKQLREQNGWTQKYLGDKLNIKDSAISKYETGRASLSDETIVTLARLFNVSSDYLLCISDIPNMQTYNVPNDSRITDKEYIDLFNFYEKLTNEQKYLIIAQMITYIQDHNEQPPRKKDIG